VKSEQAAASAACQVLCKIKGADCTLHEQTSLSACSNLSCYLLHHLLCYFLIAAAGQIYDRTKMMPSAPEVDTETADMHVSSSSSSSVLPEQLYHGCHGAWLRAGEAVYV
jgi:hypothetical protein